MTEMTDYNVRCCCQPTKILGKLRLPSGLQNRQKALVSETDGGQGATRTPVHEVLMRSFGFSDAAIAAGAPQRELAVYSDDRPIEFWRMIYGFTELVPEAGFEPATHTPYESAALT